MLDTILMFVLAEVTFKIEQRQRFGVIAECMRIIRGRNNQVSKQKTLSNSLSSELENEKYGSKGVRVGQEFIAKFSSKLFLIHISGVLTSN
jgi:hypothetical protein